jgi:hypothetical protein
MLRRLGRVAIPGLVVVLVLLGTALALWPKPIGRVIVEVGPELTCTVPGSPVQVGIDFLPGPSGGAAASQPPSPIVPGASKAFQAIVDQPDASAAARVAATYGWTCEVVTTP